MSQFVGAFNASHTPFCFVPPENWDDMRSRRQIRADVPREDLAESRSKASRLTVALGTLRRKLADARPDVVVVIASDQLEAFDLRNFPRLAVYTGEAFAGRPSSTAGGDAVSSDAFTWLKGHPAFAIRVLQGLINQGFDPAFCTAMPNPEHGLAHGLIWKAESLTGVEMPIVPVLLNCHYAPQITGRRSYEIGRALRAIIDADESDLRVAVVGTGGLWHTPGARDAYLDEQFDREVLSRLESGDIRGMADYFDSYVVPDGDPSQEVAGSGRQSTGMPPTSGPQGGTRQICNWIAAAATADGTRSTIVDYVPLYSSPIGAGFAYSNAHPV